MPSKSVVLHRVEVYKFSRTMSIFTRSRAIAAKIQSQRPCGSEKSISDENCYAHPNKRSNLSSSTELKLIKKNLTKGSVTVVEKKKMEMSEDEMSMNGAPAGDLYEIQVMSDDELFSFGSDDIARSEFETACVVDKESASWADLFSNVEVTRRMTLHHPEILLKCGCLSLAIDAAIDAALSLRSSTIRNGIACLRSLSLLDIGSVYICRIVEVLMGRSGSGPKFIATEASKVLDEIVSKIEPLVCVKALSSSTNNKNTEVSSKAFTIISQAVVRLLASNNPSAQQEGKSETPTKTGNFKEIIRLMSRGLSARSPLARDASREAFKALKASLGDVLFAANLSNALENAGIKDVQREVDVESKSVPKRRPLHAPLGGQKPTGAPVMVFTTKGMISRPGAPKAGVPARPSIKEMIKNQQRRASSLAVKAEEVAPKRAGSVVAILPSCSSPLSVVDI